MRIIMSSEKTRLLENGPSATAPTRGRSVFRKVGRGVLDILGVPVAQTVSL